MVVVVIDTVSKISIAVCNVFIVPVDIEKVPG